MGSRGHGPIHPVGLEVVVERRAVLRAMGLGAAGLALGGVGALAGCSDDDGRASRNTGWNNRTTTTGGRPAASVAAYDPDTPYWEQGAFAPVNDESTITDLRVTGSIPSDLSGLYVRNGSNSTTGRSPHWFMGDGMVHGLRIEDGRASWYRNRYVRTTLYEQGIEFADAGIPGGDISQSNVAIVHHAGHLLTLGEVGFPYELLTKDLTTVGPYDFDGQLSTWCTAHPKIDPATGKMHFFGYGFMDPLLTYHVADADGTLVHSTPIDIPAATMIHDFAVTDSDVIFWIGPVLFGVEGSVPGFPYGWAPDDFPTRVGVMPLDGDGSEMRWVDMDTSFVFHGTNAHRDGDEVVLRVNKLRSAFGPEGDLVASRLTEWRIGTGGPDLTLRQEQLNDVDMDLPSIDRRRTGLAHRHAWYVTTDDTGDHGFEFAGTLHRDMQTGREQVWDPGPHERAGEVFFVAAGPGEGEGWLLTFAYDRTTDTSALAILDAQDVAAGPVARIHLPVKVPFGFHGLWIPEDEV
jgi:carotenoid cleavage dioxygenase-like enzyme